MTLRLRLRGAVRGRARAARRQGDRARRDDAAGCAGAGGVHDHDGRLPRVHARRRSCRRGSRRRSTSTFGGWRQKTGKRFGSADDPLLVSVRSGAAVSMPGMMDTILNLGLNDEAAEGLAARTGESAVRVRLVPAADPDVRRGGRRDRRAPLRGGAQRAEEGARGAAGHRSDGRRSARAGRDVQADLRGRDRRRLPDGRARRSCCGRCGRCFAAGRTRARRSTGGCTRSRRRSARP